MTRKVIIKSLFRVAPLTCPISLITSRPIRLSKPRLIMQIPRVNHGVSAEVEIKKNLGCHVREVNLNTSEFWWYELIDIQIKWNLMRWKNTI